MQPIFHKKVTFDYVILDRFEAGISLLGIEVKSVISGHANLEGSYVRIVGTEAFLINAQILPYKYARPDGYDPKRTRKLLLHKKELVSLKTKMDGSNLTLIAIKLYNKGPRIKLEIGLAKGKKQFEKREKKRQQDVRRELERDFRGKVK